MKVPEFEWNTEKSKLNNKKHGILFDEAQTVFADPNARLITDPDHSDNEDRFVFLGMSKQLRILVVCHCYREDETCIRIISARKAKRKEIETYEEFLS